MFNAVDYINQNTYTTDEGTLELKWSSGSYYLRDKEELISIVKELNVQNEQELYAIYCAYVYNYEHLINQEDLVPKLCSYIDSENNIVDILESEETNTKSLLLKDGSYIQNSRKGFVRYNRVQEPRHEICNGYQMSYLQEALKNYNGDITDVLEFNLNRLMKDVRPNVNDITLICEFMENQFTYYRKFQKEVKDTFSNFRDCDIMKNSDIHVRLKNNNMYVTFLKQKCEIELLQPVISAFGKHIDKNIESLLGDFILARVDTSNNNFNTSELKLYKYYNKILKGLQRNKLHK